MTGILFRWLFNLETVYVVTGIVLVVFAISTIYDRTNPHRIGSALFWLLLGVIFIFGGVIPHWVTGLLVLALVALDGAGRVGKGEVIEREESAHLARSRRIGDRIFLPVIAIPVVTILVAVLFRTLGMDANRGALVGLGFGGVSAMIVVLLLTYGPISDATGQARIRESIGVMIREGRRLNESMGAVNILPQLLTSLGVIFTVSGVGDLIAAGVRHVVPGDHLFFLILANSLGMALFTIVMGNSFAAFPVIASGILVPLLIRPFGIDPAMAAIITLTAGSSGTLMTPMAANFNVVPAALLNLKDQYGVIRFQLPFAIAIWSFHVIWLWLMVSYSR